MTRKQWFIIISAIILLIALTFGIIKLTDKQDREEDAVEDIEVEQQEQVDKQVEVANILGTQEKLLTKKELGTVIEEWEEDGSIGEERLIDRVVEEYGVMNGISLQYGVAIDEQDSDFDQYQSLHQLSGLVKMGALVSNQGEGFKLQGTESDILPIKPLVDYFNPITEHVTMGYHKEPSRVIGGEERVYEQDYVFVSDTKGFRDVGGTLVGYPRVSVEDIYFIPKVYGMDSGELEKLIVEIDILITENMTVNDVIKKYTELDVRVAGEQAEPAYQTFTEEVFGEIVERIKENDPETGEHYEALGVKTITDAMKDLKGMYHYAPDFWEEDWEKKVNELYKKTILKHGVLTVQYEVPKEAIVGEYDPIKVNAEVMASYEEDDLFKYFGGEQEKKIGVVVGGEEFEIELLTDDHRNIGIYYRE